MSDFIRVPRAFKKRSKRSVLTDGGDSAATVADMGRKSFKEKEKRSFKRGSIKERWLLTRKTWKFMTDAGRRLLPEGVGNRAEDIPKIEQYFQEVCRNEPKFLVWHRKCSYPGAYGPLPRRRWKRRFGTVSPKKASSADEAEDDYFDTLEQVQYEQLMIDMLKSYLDIKDVEDDDHAKGSASESGPAISKSMVALPRDSPSSSTTATMASAGHRTNIKNSSRSSVSIATKSAVSGSGSTPGLTTMTQPRTSFTLFSSSRDSAPGHLLANMRRCGRSSSLMDQFTPEVLNDKVALRKLYDQLRSTQKFNRTAASSGQFRMPGHMPPQYQRSALGIHKTFAFPELSGKPRGHFKSPLNKSSDASSSSMLLRHIDTTSPNTSLLFGIDERMSWAPSRPARRVAYDSQGIQTDAIPLPTLNELSAAYKKLLEDDEALFREEELARMDLEPNSARNNDRRNSEDVSQSVSDTIKRYLRMARKKPPKDDANRFKRINYDRNLRNIKAKGETTKIGDDDGNCKGCQTDEDWILKSFTELSREAPKVIPAIRPTTLPRPGKTSSKHESPNATTPVSSPSSPGISSNLFHTSTQFLSNLFGHTQTTGSGVTNIEASSNDSIYGSSDAAMQKSKSSSNVGHIVSRKIWKSRSKSQSRPVVNAKPQWTPQVSSRSW